MLIRSIIFDPVPFLGKFSLDLLEIMVSEDLSKARDDNLSMDHAVIQEVEAASPLFEAMFDQAKKSIELFFHEGAAIDKLTNLMVRDLFMRAYCFARSEKDKRDDNEEGDKDEEEFLIFSKKSKHRVLQQFDLHDTPRPPKKPNKKEPLRKIEIF